MFCIRVPPRPIEPEMLDKPFVAVAEPPEAVVQLTPVPVDTYT